MKKGVKLTRKQKAFADLLIQNPKMSASQAVKQTYDLTTDNAARAIASENLTKPNIMAYLDIHADIASETVIDVMNYSKNQMRESEKDRATWANTALTASKDILDRVYGKATQRTEVNSSSVSISINLSAND